VIPAKYSFIIPRETPTGKIMQDIIDQITEPDKTKKLNA